MEEYNEITSHRYDNLRSGHMFQRKFEIVKDLITVISKTIPVKRIGEFGCGTGKLSFLLSKEFKDCMIESSDLNKGFIAYASKKYKNKNLKFSLLDVEKLKIKNKYEIIITIDLMHHLRKRELAISNINRSLSSKGYWILLDHNIYNFYILLSQSTMKNEGLFIQQHEEKNILKYFDIIQKTYKTLIPSSIKNPNESLKTLEKKFENLFFLGGYVVYLLRKKS